MTSTRWIRGSLTFCGRLARTRVTASLTSFKRPVGIGFQCELDRRQRQAVGDRGRNVPHALDTGYAVFDGLGDLRFKFGGSGAELRNRHRNHRNIGARQPRHRELGEADPAQHQEDDGENHRWKRIADRPCRDIECHQRTRVRSMSSANIVLIWSPSCSEEPASATTISPTSRPSRISVEVSDTSPTLTFRVSTTLPLTT